MIDQKDIFVLFTVLNAVILASACVTRYDDCSGVYLCLSESQNASYSVNSSCPISIPKSLVPPPDQCVLTPDGCVFVNPCIAWNFTCVPASYNCTSKTVYQKYIMNHTGCIPYQPLPLPKQQCLQYSGGTCQWYNGCIVWWNGCTNVGYHCGTLIDQYKLNQTSPMCPSNPVGLPVGECIYQNGSCVWSDCNSWMDWCMGYWLCGSEYDYLIYKTTPPPPCPLPISIPSEPGACRYNVTSNRCRFDYSINPCAVMRCPQYTVCKVYAPTGEGYCDPTCYLNNGGCNSSQQCSLEPVNCVRAPCPPVIKCSGTDPCTNKKCAPPTRCVLTPGWVNESTCLSSCYVNNGGCNEICTVTTSTNTCSNSRICSSITCSSVIGYLIGQCPTGQVYNECGSACPTTCYNHNQSISCILICVSGCFCPRGLVWFRDRCVDPLECPMLLMSPPPLRPLPMPSDTILIQLTATGVTLVTFRRMQSTFISNIRNILSNNGYRSLSVDIYDSLPSNNSNTTINIVLSIKSHQPLNDENIVSTLELHKSELPFTVNNISTVDSYYNYSSTSLLLIIGVAVASVFVLLLIIGIVILVLILISIKFFKKNRNKHNKKSTPATYVSLTDE